MISNGQMESLEIIFTVSISVDKFLTNQIEENHVLLLLYEMHICSRQGWYYIRRIRLPGNQRPGREILSLMQSSR